MPVKIGDNLTLEDNKLSAVYKELYTKLNKAYAWTNTVTTSSNGSCASLTGYGDVINVENCENIDNCSCGPMIAYNSVCSNSVYISNGKLFFNNNRAGSKTDYIMTSGNGTFSGLSNSTFCLDSSGKIWRIYYNGSSATETQIGTDSDWSFIGPDRVYGDSAYGLRNGELYGLYITNSPKRLFSSLSNIIQCSGGYGGSGTQTFIGFCLTSDGYIHYCNNTTSSIVGSFNNWSKLFYCASTSYCMAINTNNELYYISSNNIYKQSISNVKKASGSNGYYLVLTLDNKIYFCDNATSGSNNLYGTYIDKSNNKLWKDISGYFYYYYLIDEDKKLYYVQNMNNTTPTFTQIGTGTNYQKVEGVPYYNHVGIAWSGSTLTSSHTLLTTKTPQINDNTYTNENLTKYSIVTSTGPTSISDIFRTYDRDPTKDSYFNKTPTETYHETVSAIDLLNATNPNN